jgi:hypothetical protein
LAELLKRTQNAHKTYLISGILRENQAFFLNGAEKALDALLTLYKMKVQKIYFIP